MIRLLLETATDVCSVAVAKGNVVLAEHTAAEAHQHASHLTVFIRKVMDEAQVQMTDLDEIVLSDGPGSYTSLRVGTSTAKGLCLALPGLKLRVVPTLSALAGAAEKTEQIVLATIKSRKNQVFGQLFEARPQVQGEVEGKVGIPASLHPLFLEPQNIRMLEEGWWAKLVGAAGTEHFRVVGPGQQWMLGPDTANFPEQCSASLLLAPACSPDNSRLVDVATYEPFYLNPPFITKSKKKPLG